MYMFDSRLEGCKRVKESRLRHVLAGLVRFLGGPESLSFRVVRPCVREAFFEREGTGDVSFGGLNNNNNNDRLTAFDLGQPG